MEDIMIELKNLTGDKIFVNMNNVLHFEQFPSHSNVYFGKGYYISVKNTIEEIMEKYQSQK